MKLRILSQLRLLSNQLWSVHSYLLKIITPGLCSEEPEAFVSAFHYNTPHCVRVAVAKMGLNKIL